MSEVTKNKSTTFWKIIFIILLIRNCFSAYLIILDLLYGSNVLQLLGRIPVAGLFWYFMWISYKRGWKKDE